MTTSGWSRAWRACAVMACLAMIGPGSAVAAAKSGRDAILQQITGATERLLSVHAASASDADQRSIAEARKAALLAALALPDDGRTFLDAAKPELAAQLPQLADLIEARRELSGTVEVLCTMGADGQHLTTFLTHDGLTQRLYGASASGLVTGQTIRVRGIGLGDAVAATALDVVEQLIPDSTEGEHQVAMLMVNFPQHRSQPFSPAAAKQLLEQANAYYKEVSYGKASIAGDAYGWYELSTDVSTCPIEAMFADALRAADKDVDFSNVEHVALIMPELPSCKFQGSAVVGRQMVQTADGPARISKAWINGHGFVRRVLVHELGHGFGLPHANLLYCGAQALGEGCTPLEYGNPLDAMGRGSGHISASFKERLGWLDPEQIKIANSTGTYVIEPLAKAGAGVRAVKVPRPGKGNAFYIEHRHRVGFDSTLSAEDADGAVVSIAGERGVSLLLDMTPAEVADPMAVDSGYALPVGQAVTLDGVRIVTENTNGSLTVRVETSGGDTGDRQPPTVQLTAPAAGSTVSGSVTLTADARDNAGVAGVQFLIDGAPLGVEDTAAPYETVWSTERVPAGTHRLEAKARDTARLTAVASISVRIQAAAAPGDAPPVKPAPDNPSGVTLTASPTSVALQQPVTVRWQAPAGVLTKDAWVGLYPKDANNLRFVWWAPINGQASGTKSATPHTAGVYEFRIFPDKGFAPIARSNSVSIGERTPPVTIIRLTQPSAGASFPVGKPIALAAVTSQVVTQVVFSAQRAGGPTVAAGIDTQSPYQAQWTPPSAGAWTLTAVSTDAKGQTQRSEPVAITVTGSAPGTNPGPPTGGPPPATGGPVFDPMQSEYRIFEQQLFILGVNATSPTGARISYGVRPVPLPAGAQFDVVKQRLTWQTKVGQAGAYRLTFTASDGSKTTEAPVTVIIEAGTSQPGQPGDPGQPGRPGDPQPQPPTPDPTPPGGTPPPGTTPPPPPPRINRPPVLEPIGNKETLHDGHPLHTPLVIKVHAVDPDGDCPLQYSAAPLPTGATFDPVARIFHWQPGIMQQGSHHVTFRVEDGKGGVDAEDVTIFVGAAFSQPRVLGLVLINADTNQRIDGIDLVDGTVLDLAKLPTKNINVQAVTWGQIVSVRFIWDGKLETSRLDNNMPFLMCGGCNQVCAPCPEDDKREEERDPYPACALPCGLHTLRVEPYLNRGGYAPDGEALQIRLAVIDTSKQYPLCARCIQPPPAETPPGQTPPCPPSPQNPGAPPVEQPRLIPPCEPPASPPAPPAESPPSESPPTETPKASPSAQSCQEDDPWQGITCPMPPPATPPSQPSQPPERPRSNPNAPFEVDPGVPNDGLQLWLAANRISNAAAGAPVREWADLSGQQRPAQQSAAARQPRWIADAIQPGVPAVRFDGVDDQLRAPLAVNGWPAMTVALVHRNAADRDVGERSSLGAPLAWDATAAGRMLFLNPLSGEVRFRFESGRPSGDGLYRRRSPIGAQPTQTILIKRGLTEQLYVDGALVLLQGGAGATVTGLLDGLWIGRGEPAAGGTFAGDIAEVLVYNRALSVAEVTRVTDYFRAKYFDVHVAVPDSRIPTFTAPQGTVTPNTAFQVAAVLYQDPAQPPSSVRMAFHQGGRTLSVGASKTDLAGAGQARWDGAVSWSLPSSGDYNFTVDGTLIYSNGRLETFTSSPYVVTVRGSGGTDPGGTLPSDQLNVKLEIVPSRGPYRAGHSVILTATLGGNVSRIAQVTNVTLTDTNTGYVVNLTKRSQTVYSAQPTLGSAGTIYRYQAVATIPGVGIARSNQVVVTVAGGTPGVNHAPIAIASPKSLTVRPSTLVNLIGSSSYDLDGDQLTYQWVQAPGVPQQSVSYDSRQPNGSFTAYLPASMTSASNLAFTLTVWDPSGASSSDTAYVTIRRNAGDGNTQHAPQFAEDSRQLAGKAGVPIAFTITATDPDFQTLKYRVDSGPRGASINESTAAFSWTPTQDQAAQGRVSFWITAIDPDGLTDSILITVVFSDVATGANPPDVTLTVDNANPPASNPHTIIRWRVNLKGERADRSSCTASGGDSSWPGAKSTGGGLQPIHPDPTKAETVYGLSCLTPGGSRLATVSVFIGQAGQYNVSAPQSVFIGDRIYVAWSGPDVPANATIGLYGGGTPEVQDVTIASYSTYFDPPVNAGTYELRYEGNGRVLARASVTVEANTGQPSLIFYADPPTLAAGATMTRLFWRAQNVKTCYGSGGTNFTGDKFLNNSQDVYITKPSETFRMECTGPKGSIAKEVTVTRDATGGYSLSVTPKRVQPGGKIYATYSKPDTAPPRPWIGLYEQGSPNTSYRGYQVLDDAATSGVVTLTAPYATQPGQSVDGLYDLRMIEGGSPMPYHVVASAGPITIGNDTTLDFRADKTSIQAGDFVNLTWAFSEEKGSCTASGHPQWNGPRASEGTATIYFDNSATLTLSCSHTNGASATRTLSITVFGRPGPPTVSLTADPNRIAHNNWPYTTTLTLEARNVDGCRGFNGWDKIFPGNPMVSTSVPVDLQATTTYSVRCTPMRPRVGGASPYDPVEASVTVVIDGTTSGDATIRAYALAKGKQTSDVAKNQPYTIEWKAPIPAGKYWIGGAVDGSGSPWPREFGRDLSGSGTLQLVAEDPAPAKTRTWVFHLYAMGNETSLATSNPLTIYDQLVPPQTPTKVAPTIDKFEITPDHIAPGRQVTITWSSKNATKGCEGYNTPTSWTGPQASSGSVPDSPPFMMTYKIRCKGDVAPDAEAAHTVIVEGTSGGWGLTADPSIVGKGGRVTVSWTLPDGVTVNGDKIGLYRVNPGTGEKEPKGDVASVYRNNTPSTTIIMPSVIDKYVFQLRHGGEIVATSNQVEVSNNPPRQGPTFNSLSDEYTWPEKSMNRLLISVTDPAGVHYAIEGAPAGSQFDPPTIETDPAKFTWFVPEGANKHSPYSVTFVASSGVPTRKTITITVPEPKPGGNPEGPGTGQPDSSLHGSLDSTTTCAIAHGWACRAGVSEALSVEIYKNGGPGVGSRVGSGSASRAGDTADDEKAIAAQCGGNGKRRYDITLSGVATNDTLTAYVGSSPLSGQVKVQGCVAAPTPGAGEVTGRITTADGKPYAGVSVAAFKGGADTLKFGSSDADGYYRISGLTDGITYEIRPQQVPQLKTDPVSKSATPPATGVDFTAIPAATPTPVGDGQPVGTLDEATCTLNQAGTQGTLHLRGWACDSDDYKAALTVDIDKNESSGASGIGVTRATAGQSRESAVGERCGGSSSHGFVVDAQVPAEIKHGDTVYAIARNIGLRGRDAQLSGQFVVDCKLPSSKPTPGEPTAAFTVSYDKADHTVPLKVTVDAGASKSGISNTQLVYRWDFGDGTALPASATATADHTYQAPSTYTITLTVMNADRVSKSTTQSVSVVKPEPKPDAPDVSLSSDKTTYTEGEDIWLTWHVTGQADTCQAGGDWGGNKDAAAGNHKEKVTARLSGLTIMAPQPIGSSTMVFQIHCTGPGDQSPSRGVEVTVNKPAAKTYAITGTIRNPDGVGLSGALITAAGPVTKSTNSLSSGTYSIDGLPSGSYTVSVTANPFTFDSKSVTISSSNATADFQAKAQPPSVTLSSDKKTATEGDTITLTWRVTGQADNCQAGGDWGGNKAFAVGDHQEGITARVSGLTIMAPQPVGSSTMAFQIYCTGPGGPSPSRGIEVTVNPK